jgi:hypothetical protein
MNLDLRAQIQILYLNDLKLLGFGIGSNPSRILKAQIHRFLKIGISQILSLDANTQND